MGVFDKPDLASTLNASHALAPRSPDGMIFGFLDPFATSVIDNKSGVAFSNTGTVAGAPIWTEPAFPAGSGLALNLIRAYGTTGVNRYQKSGSPTSIPAFVSLAAIIKLDGSAATAWEGPRVIGTGITGGVAIEPGQSISGKLYMLDNATHVNLNVATPSNAWLACAFCWKTGAGGYVDAFVRNYTTPGVVSNRVNRASSPTASSGNAYIGSPVTSDGVRGTSGLLWTGFVDYAEWTIADFTAWAADPFSMFVPPVPKPPKKWLPRSRR